MWCINWHQKRFISAFSSQCHYIDAPHSWIRSTDVWTMDTSEAAHTQRLCISQTQMNKEEMLHHQLVDWLATGLPHKHLGLYCVDPFVRRLCLFSSVNDREARTASSSELRTAWAEQSPLLARKESFGRETTDRILSYRFDFHVTVRDF
jgi:hypothetical protein